MPLSRCTSSISPLAIKPAFRIVGRPEIIILYSHQQVAAGNLAFATNDARTNLSVEKVSAFIGTANDNGFVGTISAISFVKCIFQFITPYLNNIGKAIQPEFGKDILFLGSNNLANSRSIK